MFPYHFSAGCRLLSLPILACAQILRLQRESKSHPNTWWGQIFGPSTVAPSHKNLTASGQQHGKWFVMLAERES